VKEKGGSNLEELECVHAVIAGQRELYANLVLRYQSMVYSVCLKMTGNSSSAEELAQEVFIKAYRVLATYREEASFWFSRLY